MKESDKVDIIQALALHDVILQSKAELDQFCEGLESRGVLSAIRRNPDVARKYFCIDGRKKLTSGTYTLRWYNAIVCVAVTISNVYMCATCTCIYILYYVCTCTLCYSSSTWNFQNNQIL